MKTFKAQSRTKAGNSRTPEISLEVQGAPQVQERQHAFEGPGTSFERNTVTSNTVPWRKKCWRMISIDQIVGKWWQTVMPFNRSDVIMCNISKIQEFPVSPVSISGFSGTHSEGRPAFTLAEETKPNVTECHAFSCKQCSSISNKLKSQRGTDTNKQKKHPTQKTNRPHTC